MSSCGNCGQCGGCSGCDRSLTITEAELELLNTLAQIPFLPIARRMDDASPVYLEEDAHSPEEAAAHTVLHITKSGAYSLSGKLSLGQIAVDDHQVVALHRLHQKLATAIHHLATRSILHLVVEHIACGHALIAGVD